MRAGQFRTPVLLQRRSPSTDAEGAPLDDWTTIGTIWTDIQSTAGVEVLQAQQEEARITHQVTARWHPSLVPPLGHDCRLLWGARILDISMAMDPEQRNREIDMFCVERQR